MTTANELWTDMLNAGFQVRKNKLDGLEEWQSYKKRFAASVFVGASTIPIKHEFQLLFCNIDYGYTDHDQTTAMLNIYGTLLAHRRLSLVGRERLHGPCSTFSESLSAILWYMSATTKFQIYLAKTHGTLEW